jgi:hypothetical protein
MSEAGLLGSIRKGRMAMRPSPRDLLRTDQGYPGSLTGVAPRTKRVRPLMGRSAFLFNRMDEIKMRFEGLFFG